jgi:hypothetical protein
MFRKRKHQVQKIDSLTVRMAVQKEKEIKSSTVHTGENKSTHEVHKTAIKP